eukprot:NODE_9543_length_514_cov_0.875969_g9520_i0.p2 GENE.NODE_9543_length_514_cov_0.875969_g9520_i0~~NODE_9543_length_514_cov_0.875969_g9520_i0.p2  ORF type:complete len:106 (-),score=0.07 NODE_9543_length_514_cov_0.875969_g9520_i0:172-489(-)
MISPLTGFTSFGFNPMVVNAVTDLPEPDSPTTQTISRAPTVKLISSTANGRSAPFGRATERLRTSRTGVAAVAPVVSVADCVSVMRASSGLYGDQACHAVRRRQH